VDNPVDNPVEILWKSALTLWITPVENSPPGVKWGSFPQAVESYPQVFHSFFHRHSSSPELKILSYPQVGRPSTTTTSLYIYLLVVVVVTARPSDEKQKKRQKLEFFLSND
jgi:hypothetical protein